MRNVEPMKQRLTRLWNQVTEGWEHMRERAGGALTRFQSRSDQAGEQGGARWNLMWQRGRGRRSCGSHPGGARYGARRLQY